MRDSQRSKVYAAEHAAALDTAIGDGSVAAVQRYVDAITATPWWRMRAGRVPRIAVLDGRGRRSATAYYDWSDETAVIVIPRRMRTAGYVLHEVAHHLAGTSHEHDAKFAASMHALVRRFVGAEAATRLGREYKTHRVRWRGAAPQATSVIRAATCGSCGKRIADPLRSWGIRGGRTHLNSHALTQGCFCTKRCLQAAFERAIIRPGVT